jgi:hypothetical protein
MVNLGLLSDYVRGHNIANDERLQLLCIFCSMMCTE